jgi:hypothetical protein
MKRKRALSVHDILSYNPEVMDFEGRWEASFGKPERRGCWMVWGNSGNGKTRFALQLSKYLTRFGRVAYDSLEEGLSLSIRDAIADVGLSDAGGRFILLDREPVTDTRFIDKDFKKRVREYLGGFTMDDYTCRTAGAMLKIMERYTRKRDETITCLVDRLERRRSPDIIVIDSIQYSGLNRDSAKLLVTRFPRKLFIFISHAEGTQPSGRAAKAIRFDADLKLRVDSYEIPAPVSRYRSGKCAPFVIWENLSESGFAGFGD